MDDEAMMTSILIAGDTCPIGRNQALFQKGDAHSLLNDLQTEFDKAAMSIVNLECPLIAKESPIEKCGPNLGVPVDCVNGLKAMNIDVVGLANNHIMDHGTQGLRTTLRVLEEHDIAYVGAGENLSAASKILIREVQGVRFGILAVAEHEFGIASIDAHGANPLDIIDVVRNIKTHRDSFDRLIVLLHGGNELYEYPRPGLMTICHFLVEQGANTVICQHSHCAGCKEIYHGAPIIYGQGNFLFDYPSTAVTWHYGALICLEISVEGNFEARLIPYRQSDTQPGARRLTRDEEKSFMDGFNSRSEAIGEKLFVARQWEVFCRENKRNYLHSIHGKPGFLRRLAGKLDLLHHLDSPEIQRRRLNIILCESHREALISILTREAERK